MFDTWRIGSSGSACAGCETEFSPSEPLFSALEDRGREFVRYDFCCGCWQAADAESYFCHWRTRRPQPEAKRVLDTDLMLEFFDRLQGAEEQNKLVFRFVLALYLMRRRELKLLRADRGEGGEVLIFEQRSTGEEAAVRNPGIDEAQLEEAAGRLGRLFDAEL